MKTNEQLIDEILVEQLGCYEGQVVASASLVADLSVDSLDLVELVMAFEDTFDLEVSDEEVERWLTVGDIYKSYASAEQRSKQ